MSKNRVKRNLDVTEKNISGWDRAISDAERQIETAKARITALRGTIKFFASMKERGESFPGSEALNTLRV